MWCGLVKWNKNQIYISFKFKWSLFASTQIATFTSLACMPNMIFNLDIHIWLNIKIVICQHFPDSVKRFPLIIRMCCLHYQRLKSSRNKSFQIRLHISYINKTNILATGIKNSILQNIFDADLIIAFGCTFRKITSVQDLSSFTCIH